jgi:hypothetical protein
VGYRPTSASCYARGAFAPARAHPPAPAPAHARALPQLGRRRGPNADGFRAGVGGCGGTYVERGGCYRRVVRVLLLLLVLLHARLGSVDPHLHPAIRKLPRETQLRRRRGTNHQCGWMWVRMRVLRTSYFSICCLSSCSSCSCSCPAHPSPLPPYTPQTGDRRPPARSAPVRKRHREEGGREEREERMEREWEGHRRRHRRGNGIDNLDDTIRARAKGSVVPRAGRCPPLPLPSLAGASATGGKGRAQLCPLAFCLCPRSAAGASSHRRRHVGVSLPPLTGVSASASARGVVPSASPPGATRVFPSLHSPTRRTARYAFCPSPPPLPPPQRHVVSATGAGRERRGRGR